MKDVKLHVFPAVICLQPINSDYFNLFAYHAIDA